MLYLARMMSRINPTTCLARIRSKTTLILVIVAFPTLTLLRASRADPITGATQPPTAQIDQTVERLLAGLAEPDAAAREEADLRIRNLPIYAYPALQRIFERDSATLEPEAQARVRRSLAMFEALTRIEQRQRTYFEWAHTAALKAYDSIAGKDPAWSDAARTAIDIFFAWPPPEDRAVKLRQAIDAARKASCKDTMFQYVAACEFEADLMADRKEVVRLHRDIFDLVAFDLKCPYPHGLRAMMAGHFTKLRSDNPSLDPRPLVTENAYAQSTVSELAHVVPEDAFPPARIFDIAVTILASENYPPMRKMFLQQLDPLFKSMAPDSIEFQIYKGVAELWLSIDSRQWDPKSVPRHLAKAKELFTKAAEHDPNDPRPPLEMMKVAYRDPDGGVVEARRWLDRTLAANPDNYQACQIMREMLASDPERLLAFGHDLLDGQNFRGRLPIVLINIHFDLAERHPEIELYWMQKKVWDDVTAVYVPYLKLFPNDIGPRSAYAKICLNAHRWAEADKQFKILGDHPALTIFGSMTTYNYYRRKIAKHLNDPPEALIEE